jgi:serine/threonine protein kinase
MLFPLIPNGSMRHVLDRYLRDGGGSSSISEAKERLCKVLATFLAVCSAVQVMHSFQPAYVHQDIKPEVLLYVLPTWNLIKRMLRTC